MSLFGLGRRSGRQLPRNIVQMMETFGRFDFDPQSSDLDSSWVWRELQQPLGPWAREDPNGFVTAMAEALVPVGGWAAYGGVHTGYNFLDSEYQYPEWDRLQEASLRFLRDRGLSTYYLTGYEMQFWTAHQGRTQPW